LLIVSVDVQVLGPPGVVLVQVGMITVSPPLEEASDTAADTSLLAHEAAVYVVACVVALNRTLKRSANRNGSVFLVTVAFLLTENS
jgi:hypothetical protein